MFTRYSILICASLALGTPAAAQRPRRGVPARPRAAATAIPSPRSVLGFEPGDDRKLVEWPLLLRYYDALAKASDRVDIKVLGKTTQGAPFVALAISSPQNLRRLDYYRALNAKLADPRTLRSTPDAMDALRNGKTV